MKRFFRNNGLSIVLFGLFALCQVGMSVVGLWQHNEQRVQHDKPPLAYLSYVGSPAFLEATMENWESEFLQMFAYVVLTVFLFQKGSAESKSPDGAERADRDPRGVMPRPDAPWPVRRGGWILRLYEYSLSLALLLLFFVSFVLHAVGGAQEQTRQALLHGGAPVGVWAYLGTAQFWFESLQNWQSEFFSIGAMVVLSIFLRQRGSPESKPVDAAHGDTGSA
jgi:hypothetical protein